MMLEIRHVGPKVFRRRVDPRVRGIRHAVKLQDGDAAFLRSRDGTLELIEVPARVGVARAGDQQRMMLGRIERGAELQRAVLGLGRNTAPGEPEAAFPQDPQRLRSEVIGAMRVADRAGHAHFLQLVVDQGQLAGHAGGILGCGEVCMRPGVIANLESHLVDLGDLQPGHEILAVVHPTMRHKEGGLKSQLFEQGSDKGAVRFHGVIEREHDRLRRDARGGTLHPAQRHCQKASPIHVAMIVRSQIIRTL